MTQELTVEQCDREAAASLAEWLTAAEIEWEADEGVARAPWFHSSFPDAARKGIWDSHDFVQAFAKHRTEALAASQRGGDLELAAERLADFARDDFASTIETNWATMRDEWQQYFRRAVAVVREALAASDKGEVQTAKEIADKLVGDKVFIEGIEQPAHVVGAMYHAALNAAARGYRSATSTDVMKLRRALIDHNDALRSAQQVASREGKDTNWKTFRGHCTWVLAEHHELVNAAREALSSLPQGEEG